MTTTDLKARLTETNERIECRRRNIERGQMAAPNAAQAGLVEKLARDLESLISQRDALRGQIARAEA